MKKLLFLLTILALIVTNGNLINADPYNVQKTWATGDTITTDLNSDPQEIARILNGNLDSSNIKDGSIRDVDLDSSYPFDLTKTAGSSTTENLEDILSNTSTNDFKGWKQGLMIERSGTTKLIVNSGTVAIGTNLYQETASVEVTLATAWSASSTTGGKDSGTTYNDGDLILVFACTTTGDTDGLNFNLSEKRCPDRCDSWH